MTTEETLQQIHILLEKTTDYPIVGEGDYAVRLALVNSAIQVWESEEGVLWNELFVSLADADDGDDATETGIADYDCPTDFKFPCGYLRIDTTFFNLIKPEDTQIHDGDTSTRYWYVTGNTSVGYTYHINPIPTTTGDEIKFEYYKSASLMGEGDDVLEMSDPQFVVYWVLAELTKDEDVGLANDYRAVAIQKLRAMKTKNLMTAHWQDNQIQDYFGAYNFGK